MPENIVFDGETGQPIVSSTRTPVDGILEAIETTGTVEGALRRFPGLTAEGVSAALQFARMSSRRDTRYPSVPNYGYTELRERPLAHAGWGGGATVAVPADEYNDLRYRVDLLEGLYEAERDLEQGNGIPHDQVVARLRGRFGG
jgi:uncharacterized protein (DUF433 family)